MRAGVLAGAFALAFGAGGAGASAEEPLVPPTPFSLTISGGVSLGAYESGLLYYTLEWLRANSARSELRLTTGASAGSVNSVLAVLDQCGTEARSPSQSLFYQAWVPLGFAQLFDGHAASPRAVFSRDWFAKPAALIESEWSAGLDSRCDVVMGIAVTRVVPRSVDIGTGGDLRVGRIEERFVLRVQGRGPGRPPRVTNYADPQGQGEALLLPEGADGEISFDELRQLLFASTAVPVAFEPVKLKHCVGHPGAVHCAAADAVEAAFVDGAFFDNTPLRLAASLARAGLRESPDGSARWLDAPEFGAPVPSKALRYLFISPEATAYPVSAEPVTIDGKTTLTQLMSQEAQAFLQTARAKNLNTLAEELPELVHRVVVPARHFPAASSPMADFFGFFDGEFRRYDFYLGMYDARRNLIARLLPKLPAGADAHFSFPEDVVAASADWKPFLCLRSLFDGAGPAASCEGADLHDFRILAQTSLERLYQECRALSNDGGAEPIDVGELFCLRARAGGRPPVVPGVEGTGGSFRPRPGEGQIAWVVRLLARHHFEFRDLGGHEPGVDSVLRRIRGKMSDVVEALAKTQPTGQGLALERLGQAAANALIYVPPPHVFWLSLGREVEGGYGYRLPGLSPLAQSLRLDVALQFDGLYSLISSDVQPWGLTPLGGLEIQPPALSSETLQFGFVARGGRLFSSGDDFGQQACNSDTLGACSRWTVQAGAYGVALEILRLQLIGEWYPPEGGRHGLWAVSPSLGIQFVY